MDKQHQEPESVIIFAGDVFEAGLVRSLLDNEGIISFLKDDIMGTLMPWWVTPAGVGAVKVVVSSNDAEKAKKIIDDYKSNASAKADREA